jgi:outer membrane receptor protein involved in Fe transport
VGERSTFKTISDVLPVDADTGMQTTDMPLTIFDSGGKTGWLYSYYLQDEWKIVPTFTVNYGARFDLIDEFAHEHQLSPRVNAVWQPTETTTFTAGYSRYFVPPPFELVAEPSINLFANTTAAPAITQSTTAKAERDHYFDVGASQIILPGLKAGVDAYYKLANDLLDEGQFGAPIILTPFNYHHGIVKGVEVLLSYEVGDWSFYGNFAASKALGKGISSAEFNFMPDQLAFIAGHYIHLDHDQTYTYSSGVKYRVPTTRTLFSADLIAASGQRGTNPGDSPNGHSLPSYQQVNLSVVQPIETGWYKGMELRFDLLNVFDQVYQIRNGSGVGVGNPQFGLRRTFLAGLTQRF